MMLHQRKEAKWLRQYRLWMLMGIVFVCLSPLFFSATASAQRSDFTTYEELLQLGRGTAEVIAWRPDGTAVAVGGNLGIWLYTDDFQDIAHWDDGADVRGLAWSPDGGRLASVELSRSSQATIQVWDVVTGTSILTLADQPTESFGIAWSPDSTKLAFTVIGGVRVWDASTGQLLTSFGGHQAKTNSVAWNPNGNQLATASDDNTVKVWDSGTYQLITTLQGHTSGVYGVAWHPNRNWLATSSYDGTVRVWDIATGQTLISLEGGAYALAWSPDGTKLANSSGQTVKVWTIPQDGTSGVNASLSTLGPHTDAVISISWHPDGSRIVSVDGGSVVRIWDVNTGQALDTLQSHQGGLALSVAFGPSGDQVASSNGADVLVWNTNSGQLLNTFQHPDGVRSIAWSPNGSRIASAAVDGVVRVWEITTGQVVATFQGSPGAIDTIAWSLDGDKIATGGEGTSIGIWDTSTYQLLGNLEGHTDNITSVAWSSDSIHLVSASVDQTARVWNLATGESIVFSGHELPVVTVGWKSDGTQVATGSADRTLRLWDASNGQSLAVFPQAETVFSVSWYPLGNFLAVDQGATVHIIDVSTGSSVAVFDLQGKGVRALSWNIDGSKLAIADTAGTIRIWGVPQAPTETPIPTVTSTATFTPTETATPTPTPTTSELASFVVLGQEGVWLEQDSIMVSGDVGANVASSGPFLAEGSEVTVGIGVEFLDPASRVFGDSVFVKQGGQVYDVYYNEIGGQGQILGQQFTPLTLPLVAFPTVPSFSAGTQNFDVAQNGTLTLDAGNYGTLKLRQGATVTFTGGVYNFQEWDLGLSTNAYFAAPSEIRIANRLRVEQGSYVGPATGTSLDATDIIFYVTGQNGSSGNLGGTPKAAHIGINNTFIGNVYAPNGTLWIRQGSTARGAFLGRWVDIGIGVQVTLESGF